MRLARSRMVHVLLACSVVACASRSLPTSEPRTSAASPEAPEAEPHQVSQALSEDPPLPGAESEGWLGLQGPPAPSESHEHHHPAAPEPPAPPPGTPHRDGAPPPPLHHDGAPERAPGSNEAAPSGVRYVCPMHPEVVSSEPGRCPRCGMPLVQRP